jgi:hypothetical protein
VNVDRKHKLVRRYHVSDAALHDSQAVDHLLMQGNTGAGVWAERSLITPANVPASRFRQVSGGQTGIERPETVKNRGALQ